MRPLTAELSAQHYTHGGRQRVLLMSGGEFLAIYRAKGALPGRAVAGTMAEQLHAGGSVRLDTSMGVEHGD